jgi:hypothetical protein
LPGSADSHDQGLRHSEIDDAIIHCELRGEGEGQPWMVDVCIIRSLPGGFHLGSGSRGWFPAGGKLSTRCRKELDKRGNKDIITNIE